MNNATYIQDDEYIINVLYMHAYVRVGECT